MTITDPATATHQLHQLIGGFLYCLTSGKANALEGLVRPLLEHCPFPVLFQFEATNLYRVREGDVSGFDTGDAFLSNISEFKVNPNASTIGIGRCNLPGIQIHYCAFEERTAQFEAISSFRKSENRNVEERHVAYIGRWQSTRVLRLVSLIDRDEDRTLFKNQQTEWADFVQELISFLMYVFSHPADDCKVVYTFTSMVTSIFLERFDGIVYPSSITGSGNNVALKPALIEDGSVMFCNASRIRRNAYAGDGSRVDNWLGYVCNSNGDLLWSPSITTFRQYASRGVILGAYQPSIDPKNAL